jgi:hypothetical protein
MKKLLFLFVFSLVVKCIVAQDVTGFKYQAVVRDNSEELMVDKSVDIKLSIIDLSGDGTTLYTESHTKSTNAYGLIDLIIGEGTAETGVFQDIVWDENKKYLKIELDSGSGLKNLGTVQLLSVPFSKFSNSAAHAEAATIANSALHADVATLANSASTLGGENVYSTTSDTLFVVKDNSGNVVFAVFPDGAKVYINESAKGTIGGFAVTGRGTVKKALETDIFKVTPDSTRIFVNPTTAKGKVGGFAVSGRNPNKSVGNEYLVITPDSTRIYVDQSAKGKVGGFAVSGRNPNKGATVQFLDLTPDNYLIGHQTGARITTGLYNIMLGYESGLSNTTGSYNTFLGYQTGYLNTASYNSFLGYLAGRENTIGEFNTFMGYESGRNNDEGDYNVFLGHQTGYSNTSGHENVFIGYRSGFSNSGGYDNIFIGNLAGENASGNTHSTFIGNEAGRNVTGDDNIYIGDRAGTNAYVTNHESFGTVILGIDAGRNVVGQNNTVLGYGAGSSWGGESTGTIDNTYVGAGAGGGGFSTRLGSYNVCLGNDAGASKTGDNKLYIANNSTTTLIYGEFDNNQVVINGEAADNPSDYTFFVNGTASGSNPWANTSDERKKKNIKTIDSALDKVLKLRGVSFDWKDPEMKGHQIGFIAQEAKEVIPEVVLGSDETEYSMQYAPITAVLVEAVKEQQSKIDTLEKENEELIERLERLEKLILK